MTSIAGKVLSTQTNHVLDEQRSESKPTDLDAKPQDDGLQEIVISPFPGAFAVYRYDPANEPDLLWSDVLPVVVTVLSLLLLYFGQ